MSEQKNVSKPVQLWNSAVKAVKGENTGALVEQFTSEMTLVAEGLCEDQARLRQSQEDMRREADATRQSLHSGQQALEQTMKENQRELERRLEELERRLHALEAGRRAQPKHRPMNRMGQAIVLAGIICGTWLAVTVLNLLA